MGRRQSHGYFDPVRICGGVGSLPALFLPVPSVGGLLALARFVLTLIAARCVSENQKGAELWKDMLVSMVTAIGGVLAGSSLLSGALRSMQLNDLNFADFGRRFNPSTVPPRTG